MAIITQPDDDVQVELAEPAEIQAAVAAELERLGMTYDELQQQAADEEFTSERAAAVVLRRAT